MVAVAMVTRMVTAIPVPSTLAAEVVELRVVD
jgi:hypothetical protein